MTRKEPGAAIPAGEAGVPVRRWQRVQWHQPASSSGASTSKRTAPHTHPPVSMACTVRHPSAAVANGSELRRGSRRARPRRPIRRVLQRPARRRGQAGCLTWTNPAWTNTLGWSAEELDGLRYAELLHPATARTPRRSSAQLHGLPPGTTELIEARVRTRDGDYRHVLFSISIPRDEATVYLCGRDVSDERRAIAELGTMHARYRGVVANLPGAIVALFDAELRLMLVDGPQLERRGLSADLFTGRRLPRLLAAGGVSELQVHFDAVLTGEPRAFDYRSLDGRIEYVVHLLPIAADDSDVAGMALMIDVTARARRPPARSRGAPASSSAPTRSSRRSPTPRRTTCSPRCAA